MPPRGPAFTPAHCQVARDDEVVYALGRVCLICCNWVVCTSSKIGPAVALPHTSCANSHLAQAMQQQHVAVCDMSLHGLKDPLNSCTGWWPAWPKSKWQKAPQDSSSGPASTMATPHLYMLCMQAEQVSLNISPPFVPPPPVGGAGPVAPGPH